MPTQSIIIKAGQTVVLPRDVVVKSIFTSGSINVTSTCNNLPPATTTACFVFSWEVNATPAFADAYFSHLILTDTFSYELKSDPNADYESGGLEAAKVAGQIKLIPNFVGVIIASDQASVASLRQIKIRLPDFGILPKLRIVQPTAGYGQILYLEAVKTDCTVPGGWVAW